MVLNVTVLPFKSLVLLRDTELIPCVMVNVFSVFLSSLSPLLSKGFAANMEF